MMYIKEHRLFSFFAVGVALLFAGCAALSQYGQLEDRARENSARGNFDQAVLDVVQSLKLKPDYEKSQQLLIEIFPQAVEMHLARIDAAKNSSAAFKWDKVVAEYVALDRISGAVDFLIVTEYAKIKNPFHFDLRNYSQELTEPLNKAAEDHYQEGLLHAKVDSMESQKKAASAFRTAMGYVSDYKNCEALYEKARKAGIKRIAIITFENKSGKSGYGAVGEAIVDGVVGGVTTDPSASDLLEVVPRSRLEQVMREQKLGVGNFVDNKTASKLGKILGVHEIVVGSINQIVASPQRDTRREIHKKQHICEREDKNHKCEHEEEARAEVTVIDRTAGATISVTYNVMDVKTGEQKQTKNVFGRYAFNAEWAIYRGNEKALSAAERQLVAHGESNSPVDEEMVGMAQGDLVKQIALELKNSAR